MKYLLAALLLLQEPIAFAQAPSEAEITQRFTHQARIAQDIRALIPKMPASYDSPRQTHAEVTASVARIARQDLPRIEALIAEIKAIPPLRSTGDPERDAGLRTADAEALRMAETVKGMIEATIDQDESMRAQDDARIDRNVRQISLYSLDLLRSGAVLIRAGKSEPGSQARRDSIEALAVVADGMAVVPQLQTGLIDADQASKSISAAAKSLREQASLIRQDFAANPGNDGRSGAADIHAARLAFPSVLEQAAAEFEIAAFNLATGAFGYQEAEAFTRKPNIHGVSGAFYAAWPG